MDKRVSLAGVLCLVAAERPIVEVATLWATPGRPLAKLEFTSCDCTTPG